METKPLVVERTYTAPIKEVWQALTDKDQMKKWYFDLEEFKAEPGFEFDFYGGSEDMQYHHLCKVIAVEEPVKLSYTWRYAEFEGESLVTFELFELGVNKTAVKLTHTGLDSFPQNSKDFQRSSFNAGWDYILGTSLLQFLER